MSKWIIWIWIIWWKWSGITGRFCDTDLTRVSGLTFRTGLHISFSQSSRIGIFRVGSRLRVWVISYNLHDEFQTFQLYLGKLFESIPDLPKYRSYLSKIYSNDMVHIIWIYFLSSMPRRSPFRSVFVSWLNWQSGRSNVHPRSAICCSVGLKGISWLSTSSFCLFRRRLRSRRLSPRPACSRRPPRFRRAFSKLT